jgi:hypothetical protein
MGECWTADQQKVSDLVFFWAVYIQNIISQAQVANHSFSNAELWPKTPFIH